MPYSKIDDWLPTAVSRPSLFALGVTLLMSRVTYWQSRYYSTEWKEILINYNFQALDVKGRMNIIRTIGPNSSEQ